MATRKATPKPTPIVVSTVCSICGLDWEDHSANPDVLECVELLKAAAHKPRPIKTYPTYPAYPYWYSTSERPVREETWKNPWTAYGTTGNINLISK